MCHVLSAKVDRLAGNLNLPQKTASKAEGSGIKIERTNASRIIYRTNKENDQNDTPNQKFFWGVRYPGQAMIGLGSGRNIISFETFIRYWTHSKKRKPQILSAVQ